LNYKIRRINLEPQFRHLEIKTLVGKKLSMSFAANRTFELWRSFMPQLSKIKNRVGLELYSVEIYPQDFFKEFHPTVEFEKWAAVEVTEINSVPPEMEKLIIQSGMYAVFIHRGPASAGPETYNYIFGTWLPGSDYILDNRPHFALMGEKYKNDDPESEEEIWIPVKQKM
jgi:AraC family transcriptional regulator